MQPVILYTNHCTMCNALKDALDAANIQYVEFTDVDKMLEMGMSRMPQLQISADTILTYKQAIEWLKERNN